MYKNSISLFLSFLFVLALSACSSDNSSTNNTNMSQEFLPVEQAFKFSAKVVDSETLQARWNIADGYHLYKDKLNFKITTDNFRIVGVDYPQSTMLNDKTFGKKESYSDQLVITIKLHRTSEGDVIKLQSGYQGCAKQGLCYPPQINNTKLDLTKV